MTDGRVRILMTADAVGGVWSYALTLAEALGERAEILLAVMGPRPSAAQRAAAAAVPSLRLVESDFALEWIPGAERDLAEAGRWLKAEAAAFRPDIVHVNGYAAACQMWPAPVLVVAHSCVLSWWRAVHGTDAPAEWRGYAQRVSRALAAADRVVAPTRAMLGALFLHYGLPRGGEVIANGCHERQSIGAGKQRLVLAAGRLWDEAKGIAALDEAAAQIRAPVFAAGDCRHPGRGPATPRRIRALGALAPDALAWWMARAAIFAAPARYEPFGLSILEAASAGCALVLGDIPSLRELWAGAALFVPPGDSVLLAAAINSLMSDEATRADLALAARRRAERYSAAAMAARYARLYHDMTAPRPTAKARAGVF